MAFFLAALPWIAGSVGAGWLLTRGTKPVIALESDVQRAKAEMNAACDRTAVLVKDADSKDVLTTDLVAKSKQLGDEQTAVNGISTFWGANFQEIIARASAVTTGAFVLSGQLASKLGVPNPVSPPESGWTWKDYAVLAAVGLGACYVYQRWSSGQPLLGGHGETIPRSQLPRYAGGSRK